jgi:hypothetical protein
MEANREGGRKGEEPLRVGPGGYIALYLGVQGAS